LKTVNKQINLYVIVTEFLAIEIATRSLAGHYLRNIRLESTN